MYNDLPCNSKSDLLSQMIEVALPAVGQSRAASLEICNEYSYEGGYSNAGNNKLWKNQRY